MSIRDRIFGSDDAFDALYRASDDLELLASLEVANGITAESELFHALNDNYTRALEGLPPWVRWMH